MTMLHTSVLSSLSFCRCILTFSIIGYIFPIPVFVQSSSGLRSWLRSDFHLLLSLAASSSSRLPLALNNGVPIQHELNIIHSPTQDFDAITRVYSTNAASTALASNLPQFVSLLFGVCCCLLLFLGQFEFEGILGFVARLFLGPLALAHNRVVHHALPRLVLHQRGRNVGRRYGCLSFGLLFHLVVALGAEHVLPGQPSRLASVQTCHVVGVGAPDAVEQVFGVAGLLAKHAVVQRAAEALVALRDVSDELGHRLVHDALQVVVAAARRHAAPPDRLDLGLCEVVQLLHPLLSLLRIRPAAAPGAEVLGLGNGSVDSAVVALVDLRLALAADPESVGVGGGLYYAAQTR
mmetsp:Transcript_27198/g.48087  ORF Transcript_27198/g.48087 Transcript_27198/m.48087 type:complete len:349 (-) Transcript_27198:1592-2638(-)